MRQLVLAVQEVRDDRLGWRWRLTTASGEPLADRTVELDPDAPELAAFTDLPGFLRAHAMPDRRIAHEAELVARLGRWLGTQVLGAEISQAIVAAAPVTVRVVVPPAAEFLLFRPLELAYVDGAPLARRGDVSLVYDVGAPGLPKPDVAERLRMLAVFSLPTEQTALGLRRERYALARLIRGLAAERGWAIDLEVRQYGVTRQLLADRMAYRGGPDLLHLSGHGGRGALLLEHADGSPDSVSTAELVPLLAPAKGRLKLAVVSACDSAAAAVAETLGWLGEDEAAALAQAEAQAAAPITVDAGVAGTVTRELDCAVVAMRYPVSDEFAIDLAQRLYGKVFGAELPLDRALPPAVAAAAGEQPSVARPALSLVTPALFGTRAAGLALIPPPGQPSLGSAEVKMPGFPDEPERFVGRARVMAAASAALARDGGYAAVLFHGMAGAGKTWCALELAYRHEHGFGALAFWQAPTNPDEWAGALTRLAMSLEQQLGRFGFAMVDKIGTAASLREFLPVLSRLLADNGLLLVLDNLETLLTPEGQWRDPRWAALMAALTGHRGFSRTILTSQIRPADGAGRVLVEPVHALSRDESLVLARELPNLRTLLHADPVPTRSLLVEDDRAVVRRVLQLVQGHPKLLELADAAAVDRDILEKHLAAAQTAAESHGSALSAFFRAGESSLDADGFLDVLTTWTASTVATLPDEARLLLQLLCLLEDGDRTLWVVDGNWSDLWCRRERPGDPPDLANTLSPLVTAALVHPEPVHSDDGDQPLGRFVIHPGVAEAVRSTAPDQLRPAVDTELAAWWCTVFDQARGREGGEDTGRVVHAGLAAVPYLLRLRDWDTAARLLERVHLRDGSPPVVQAVLPHLARIATTTGNPDDAGLYARVLASVDPARAEQLLRQVIDTATAAGNNRTAGAFAGTLANLLRDTGRLAEALALADQMAGHTKAAGLGPWTRLNDRGQRLSILYQMGEVAQVLAEVETLRGEMARLPDQRGPTEAVDPWQVRENTLHIGTNTAAASGRWLQALDLNAERLASQQARGAGSHELARTRFDNYGPLLRLGRIDEADTLLQRCQQVFEHHQDIPWLGRVLGARAGVADERDHPTQAVGFELAALRYKYVHPDPDPVAGSHHNLALYLSRTGDNPGGQVAHQLAAGLLYHLAGMRHDLAHSVYWFVDDLRTLGDQAPIPATVAEVATQVEQVDGVHFAELVQRLQPDPAAVQAALDEIIQVARELPDTPPT